ncbi:hypothetical protein [Haloarchaeobius sp. DFWS5]|uniref:hypothetical protein n=1 Tax=Haloarchaeobius sp. DFWS5 TaxID=3446114 RepID=UPI003EB85E0B
MDNGDGIVRTEFTQFPKHVHPVPESDWATVDFVAGPCPVVVIGQAQNGDSRHRFAPGEIRVESRGDDQRLHVTMQIFRDEREGQLVLSGPSVYYYRLVVEFPNRVPNEYVIRHLDEHGDEQYRTFESYMGPPADLVEE